MKPVLLFISALFCCILSASAAHIIGGEMRYEYVGPGSTPGSKVYRIVLWLARGESGATFANSYVVGIYNNDNNTKVAGTAVNNNWLVTMENPPGIGTVPIVLPSCIEGAPVLNYTHATYTTTVELPNNSNGYTIAYQTCCRINGINNVGNNTGSTYSCTIPGSSQLPPGQNDSSPKFKLPVNVICKDAPFTLDFGAIDNDPGDSLVYSLCNAFDGGAAIDAGFSNPAPPPYNSVVYTPPYNSIFPLGSEVTINPQTGLISGRAPGLGKYVVCVCINVYKNGVLVGTHRKDLIVDVSDCVVTNSDPMPDFVTCDGFNVQFSHTSTGANSVYWDFGDNSSVIDTSVLGNPTYTYADTGTYTIKLVINRGTSCSDSTYRKIGVYPGFFPGFASGGICYLNPVQFTDTTRSRYGVVNSWTWNFGDGSTLADTSRLQNPAWTYASPGTKTIQLIATSSKGCRDTVTRTIDLVDKPPISLGFKDTLICIVDNVQLQASGSGNFSWTPSATLSNASTANPIADPTVTTTYFVELENSGCRNRDSVRVRVLNNVTVIARPDTTICEGDPVQLGATTDGLTYSWSPTTDLTNPSILNPVATPAATTSYQLQAFVGSCSATDNVTVTVVPYPVANAGEDTTICYNTIAQLSGSHNGSSFTWSPVNYLTNPNILNPQAVPPRTTPFILSVTDNRGCPKPGRDTVLITVLPPIRPFAGNDTSVIVGQPLQFNASGGTAYSWSPPLGLSGTDIFNPVGNYDGSFDSIRYTVQVYNDAGCFDSASVRVKIFKTIPTIFVPTGFTPNNDGRNDVVRPIAVGIQKINYFRIYNRWGQMVFSTSTNGHGWDGRIGGTPQGTNVFVWLVSAVDYLGKPYFAKGTVTLIR
ncbi:MAG TPA: PKD domain-containing protein [Chitinophagaceae bacterium]|nr:PKD domain-containing protein [Chitinophagaceae bacterium]